ncbi:MAG: class I SAM-dependent methyltransferase [Streptosporangiaceae bacterium]
MPGARLLADRGWRVLGVDFSAVQVGRAADLVPAARFARSDMTGMAIRPASLDAIVSLYALIHVPLADQRELLPRLRGWLHPGGYLLAIVGAERWTGVDDYLGAEMFWDHEGTQAYLEWLAAAGLAPRWHRFIPEGTSGHTLVLAQAVTRPARAG